MFTARYGLNLSMDAWRFVLIGLRLGLLSSTDGSESLAPNLFSRHYSMRCVGGNTSDGNELPGTLPFCGVIMTGETQYP